MLDLMYCTYKPPYYSQFIHHNRSINLTLQSRGQGSFIKFNSMTRPVNLLVSVVAVASLAYFANAGQLEGEGRSIWFVHKV